MRMSAQASSKAASQGISWAGAKGQALALASREATASGSAWTTAKTRMIAQVSSEAASSSLSWAWTNGHAFALASRDAAAAGSAWAVAKTRSIARTSSTMASQGISWTRAKGYAAALASRDAAAAGSAWGAEKSRALMRASLSVASTGWFSMRAEANHLTHKVRHASETASPWMRAKADGTSVRLQALKTAAREVVHRQSEHASLIALRLSAQAKGELDALRRAAHAGELTPQALRKLIATGLKLKPERSEPMSGHVQSTAEPDGLQNGAKVSSNALICLEPWRCRLPAVQTGSPNGRFAP
jgi:hypothetical protein